MVDVLWVNERIKLCARNYYFWECFYYRCRVCTVLMASMWGSLGGTATVGKLKGELEYVDDSIGANQVYDFNSRFFDDAIETNFFAGYGLAFRRLYIACEGFLRRPTMIFPQHITVSCSVVEITPLWKEIRLKSEWDPGITE